MRATTVVGAGFVVLGLIAGVAVAGRPSSPPKLTLTASASSGSNDDSAPTTTTATRGRDEVHIVLSAAALSASSISLADELATLGYTDVTPVDPIGEQRDDDVVYHLPGSEAECKRLVIDLDLPGEACRPLPASLEVPTELPADLVVVAGRPLP